MSEKESTIQKRINSFRYAFKGLADLFLTQPHARFHAFAAIVVTIAGLNLGLSKTEWCIITLAIFLVISAEAFNTAIEYLTDLVSPDYHPLAGKTKDVAAAGVLIISFGAAIVGVIIFWPKIF